MPGGVGGGAVWLLPIPIKLSLFFVLTMGYASLNSPLQLQGLFNRKHCERRSGFSFDDHAIEEDLLSYGITVRKSITRPHDMGRRSLES